MSSAAPEVAPTPSLSSSPSLSRRFRATVLAAAVLLGAISAWHGGDLFIYDDAVSYLDVASAWLHHDWRSVANAYWSPGYSWLLAAGLGVVRPSGYWEPAVVRSISFLLFVAALFCFAHFWRELTAHLNRRALALGAAGGIPERSWYVFGVVLFLYGALLMIGPYRDSPDMTVAAVVFLASAALVQIRDGEERWSRYVYLGVLLAAGYYIKAVMFPMALVFIVAAVLAARNKKLGALRAGAALAVFLLLSAPWITVLSQAKGRLTFGDSGKLNYLWYNDLGWSGDGYPFPWSAAVAGAPVHPMRQLLASPRVYEFKAPFQGSYPPWDDPSYFYEGARTRISLRLQLRRLLSAGESYERILQGQSACLAGVLFLFLLAWPGIRRRPPFAWSLLLVGFAGLGVYAPVRADNRYVAPFFVLIWAALFAGLYLFHLKERRRILGPLVLAISLVLLVPVGLYLAGNVEQTIRRVDSGAAFDHSDAEVAAYLRGMGVRAGDSVGYIQSSEDTFNKYWARLANVTIVADIPYQDTLEFWGGNAALQNRVVNAFRSAGAKVLVAYRVPLAARSAGWQKIGKTDYYVLPCNPLSGS